MTVLQDALADVLAKIDVLKGLVDADAAAQTTPPVVTPPVVTPPVVTPPVVTPPPTPFPTIELPNLPAVTVPAGAPDYNYHEIKSNGASFANVTVSGGLGFKLPHSSTANYNVDGLTISGVTSKQVSGVMRCYGGSLSNASFSSMSLPNIVYDAGVSGSVFISVNTTLKNIAFKSIDATLTTPITDSGDNYAGFSLSGKGTNDVGDNISWQDVRVTCVSPGVNYGKWVKQTDGSLLWVAETGKYPNRDGIAVEAGYNGLSINRVHMIGFPDGGIDMKSATCHIDNYTGTRNGKTLRQWAICHHGKIHSENPTEYHFMMMGDGLREFDAVKLTDTTSTKPVVLWESGGSLGNGPAIVKINQIDLTGVADHSKIVWIKNNSAHPVELHLPDGTVHKA